MTQRIIRLSRDVFPQVRHPKCHVASFVLGSKPAHGGCDRSGA
jgi:hypothetical protein